MQIPICVVGCGGMGHRHMLGYKELKNTGIGNLEVVAVCDINRDMAELVANEAAGLLGRKPMVFDDLEKALAHPDIAAVDVVTDGASHHKVAVAALEAGKHAMVEKPLGVSVRACKAMIKASRENDAVLATAENYRRDPVMRLIRAIIDHGLIGEPHLMIQIALGHGDTMAATPWRHLKVMGAIGMDMGVHYADLFQYFLGEYDLIFGKGLIVEPLRKRPNAENDPLSSHRERNKLYPETIEATGADSVIACYTMESGAVVQLSFAGGRGSRGWERSIHGRWGAIYAPQGERTGGPVLLRLKDRELRGKEILAELPGFELDEIAARLFGRGRSSVRGADRQPDLSGDSRRCQAPGDRIPRLRRGDYRRPPSRGRRRRGHEGDGGHHGGLRIRCRRTRREHEGDAVGRGSRVTRRRSTSTTAWRRTDFPGLLSEVAYARREGVPEIAQVVELPETIVDPLEHLVAALLHPPRGRRRPGSS